MTAPLTPDETALLHFLEGARFRAGASKSRWRLDKLMFPHVVISIRARDGTFITLRFECSGYPNNLPTAQPWDLGLVAPLCPGQFPRGAMRISSVFRPDWKNGTALYLPCDRHSIDGHGNWNHEHADKIWNPARGLAQYLEIVYDLLQSSDFHVVQQQA
jgi:hypothetical protein